MIMKTLLINPPQTYFPGSQAVVATIPLGIMYIAAVLEREGYEVEILDTLIADFRLRREGEAKQYGMSWERIAEEIKLRQPSVVGITNPFTAQIDNTVRTAEIVKDIDHRIPVVVGGPHISVISPAQFLKDTSSVDIVVIGEGEYTMLDIVRYLSGDKDISEIDGIAYRKGGNVIVNHPRTFNNDLDELPFPAYHLVNMEEYLNPKQIRYRSTKYMREFPMITSRGCPFNCVFCSIHLHMGRKWRAHSKDYVIAHIEHVVNKYGIEHIHFEDDNLTLNMERFEGILDDLIAKDIKIGWDTPNGVRPDRLNIGIIEKMKQSGCTNLIIGVESGDQWVLDHIIDKHLHLEDVVNMAQMCKGTGIKLAAFFVIGFPGEREENMQRTIKFALQLKKEYGVNMCLLVATPLYGTRLYDICREKGYLTQELTPRALSEATQPWGKGLIRTEDFTPEEVKELASNAYSLYNRLSLLDYIKHPERAVKEIVRSPQSVIPFLRRLAKR